MKKLTSMQCKRKEVHAGDEVQGGNVDGKYSNYIESIAWQSWEPEKKNIHKNHEDFMK